MSQQTLFELLESYLKNIQPYYQQALVYADQARQQAQLHLYEYCPQAQHLNRFQIFLVINFAVLSVFVLIRILALLNPARIYRKGVELSFSLPFVKSKLRSEIQQSQNEFLNKYPKQHRSQLKKIPYNPVVPNFGNESEIQSAKGHLSGSRYPQKKHSDFVVSLAKQFSYSNPLHFDLHPYLKQMQVQVLKMCAKMLNFFDSKGDAVGGFFSGGTQSILMAILSYREYGIKHRGVKCPNLVICDTGHAAALKACDLFNIELRIVKSDRNHRMSVSDTKANVDHNTIAVYTSFPNYPYGTVDPIKQIAYFCNKKGVPVHIDMCLGGFLVPFLKNQDGSPFFQVPRGVTSISMDCHKYGLAAKGSSVLLFSAEKYRKQGVFVTSHWPGGYYGTIGIAGSRTGATIVSSWVSMMRLGVKGYTKNANLVRNAVLTLSKELKALGFKVFGKPEICCIGFSHPKYPTSMVKDVLKSKGWDFPIIQKPIAMHYSFTPLNAGKVDEMVADIKASIPFFEERKNQKKDHKGSELQLYGICSKIPDTGAKGIIMKSVLDCFLEI